MLTNLLVALQATAQALAACAKTPVVSGAAVAFERVKVLATAPSASLPLPAPLPASADVAFELATLLEQRMIPQFAAAEKDGLLSVYRAQVPPEQQLHSVPSRVELDGTYDHPRHAAALRHLGGLLPYMVRINEQIMLADDAVALWPRRKSVRMLRNVYSRLESLARALPLILVVSPHLAASVVSGASHACIVLDDDGENGAVPAQLHQLSVPQIYSVVHSGVWAFWYQDSFFFRIFRDLILVSASAVHHGYQHRSSVARVFSIIGWGLYYALFRRKAVAQYGSLVEHASIDYWSFFWNLQETPFIAFWDSLTFPWIRVNKMYEIPLPDAPDDAATASSLDAPKTLRVRLLANRALPPAVQQGLQAYLVDGSRRSRRAAPPVSRSQPGYGRVNSYISTNGSSSSPSSSTGGGGGGGGMAAGLPRVPVIVHIHGGGFIAMTSKANQVYSRVWARQASEAVMFSLDYSLAPMVRHPTPINECFAFYEQLVTGAFGFLPSPLTMVGDSAGGNLVAAVTLRAVQQSVPVPDSIQLMYPAMVLRNVASPARLLCGGDPILPAAFVKVCQDAFMPASEKLPYDPEHAATPMFKWLHPGCASDHELAKFPPTRIICGELDPLLDDSIDLYNRLHRLNVPVSFKCHVGMPHGFLNYGRFVPGVNRLIRHAGELLRDAVVQRVPGDATAPDDTVV